ncbi:MAG: TonB-dependent receptor [Polyangiaceae bacterium]|nr:TonB-dependent receptor [Polyangiaceae bacterium]MCW5789095.1 TonB-dependent receptor [Polyangiaceae bacterium]
MCPLPLLGAVAAPARADTTSAPTTPPANASHAATEVAPIDSIDDDSDEDAIYVHGAPLPRSAGHSERTRRVLSAAPSRTASDLLLTVPGTFVTQHSGEGKAHQIFFRGFDALHGQDLELWVGGAPVNEVSHIHGQGYADLHFLMPEVVQRVRARPGPFSPDQGDFAVAGSIDFDLGFEEPGFTLKGSVGSFGARRAFIAYHPEGMSHETFGAFESYSSDGFGVGRAAERSTAVGQLVQPLSRGVELRLLTTSYSGRFGSAGVLRLADVEAGADRFGSYDTAQGGHSARHQLLAELRGASGEHRFHFTPYLTLRQLTLRHNFTGFLQDPVGGDATQQQNGSTTLGFRAAVSRALEIVSPHDSVSVGLAGRGDFIEQSDRRLSVVTREVSATQVDATVSAAALSGWVDLSLRPVRRLAVRGGARIDALSYGVTDHLRQGQVSSAQGAHVGPKLSLDFAIAPGARALASYGEGFRSPQARSLGDGERTPFTRVRSYELGLRLAEGRRVSLGLAGFHTALSDDVVFVEALAKNVATPATRRVGGVLDFVAEPTPGFTSALGATYTRASFTETSGDYLAGARVPFVPELTVRSDLAATRQLAQPFGRPLSAGLGVGLTYLYRRPIPYGELGDDVFLMDVKASARLAGVELSLEAMNLLDLPWNDGEFVYASSFERGGTPSLVPARHVSAGAPRTLMATLSLTI